jgi:hypothetical protein
MVGWVFLSGLSVVLADTGAWAPELARGNTGLADPEAMGSLLSSPGIIGLIPRYELGFGYVFGPEGERRLQAGAIDSLTSPVALAITYQRTTTSAQASWDELPGWVEPDEDFSNPRARSLVGASLGKGLNEGRLGLGIGVHYDHDISRFGGEYGQVDLSAGVASHLAEQVTLALSANHLVPYEQRLSPLDLGAGIHWRLAPGANVELNLHGLFPDGDLILSGSGGLSVTVAERVPIRAGFERDSWAGEDRLWAGLGLVSDNSSLDYGIGIRIGQQETARFWNGLSLRVNL